MSNALQIIQGDIQSIRPRFEAMAGDSLSFEREAGFAIQILMANDYATRIATENRQSVINAVVNVAAIGISLNPAKKQAYLVPRDGRICLDISYMGLLDLAIQSGSILWGQADLVHLADKFTLNGFDRPPTHERDPFSPERGPVIGTYVVVKTRDGDYLTATMPIAEVHEIRDRSSAWKAWINKKKSCPWVTDEGEMVKKTVIKRAYKLWPKTERFERVEKAIEHLNIENEEGLALDERGPWRHQGHRWRDGLAVHRGTSIAARAGKGSRSGVRRRRRRPVHRVRSDRGAEPGGDAEGRLLVAAAVRSPQRPQA